MKTLVSCKRGIFALILFTIAGSLHAVGSRSVVKDSANYVEFRGMVEDQNSGDPLSFASVMVIETNLSTVTNTEGKFSIKVPKEFSNGSITINYIGYKSKTIMLSELSSGKAIIKLQPTAVELPEVSIISKDAESLMRAVMERKGKNYLNEPTNMTAFYRETIKKNKNYVSLSEAVVEINKQAYTSYKSDIAKLYKARKKADYSKLDTVTFKLMGGPFNSLNLDVMKNPELIFTEDMFGAYDFSFDRSTHMDKHLIYVLDFKQRIGRTEPLYYGKLYIDAQTLTLRSAVFMLNLSNRDEAASMFVVKKPANAKVYPIHTSYRIDYAEKDGKWYYGYSRMELGLKIDWKKRFFNTSYFSTLEMAVTDWKPNPENLTIPAKDRLKRTVIVSDEASGFSDPEFWGEYNVIEPEKSIESAIRKIKKQLDKKSK